MSLRQLYLMRHAKSSWKFPLPDVDRPLNQRGEHDAPLMGQRLAKRQVHFDYLAASHALRALRTAQTIAAAVAYPVDTIRIRPELYSEGPVGIIRLIQSLDDQHHHVMLLGHNPTVTALANCFAHTPIANVPTAGVVHLEVDLEHWAEFRADAVQLADFDYPKRMDD